MQGFRRISHNSTLITILATIAILILFVECSKKDEQVLNLLCWTGYEERSLLDVFEKKYNIKVNAKTFVGADAMFSLLTQTTATYDVVVVDPEYIKKLHAAGRLAELNPADYDFTGYLDELKEFPLCYVNGNMYAILVEYGSNGLVYNTKYLKNEDVQTYEILWSRKVEDRVGIWDWYLPSMGVISISLGHEDPYNISDQQFQAILDRLKSLRPQVRAIHSSPTEMISALANEETWIVPAGGEWVAAFLQQQGKPIDWIVPEEGGIMWMDALCIVNDASHPDAAKTYIRWMMTPEAQALLSQKQAYQSNVPNMMAYNLLTKKQKDMLKVHNDQEALALVNRLHVRSLPINQPEKEWQDAWEEFKASK